MFKRNAVSAAALACLGLVGTVAFAQNAATLERVEITGSSIKRIASEGALPVQVITAEEIRSTGASNLQDVIQRIPAMQGFTIADVAIGSNSGGYSTASIHDLGSSYTLVLVNGRRIAPVANGSTYANLNSIPMSAIERVEVLTDGASALYGSDAIAGVVNFVLKKNYQGFNASAQYSNPIQGGGKSYNVSVTGGFGDLDKNGFNILGTFRHDNSAQLKSGDRDFAKSAYLPISLGGKNYVYDRTSTSADPANASVVFKRLASEASTTAILPSYSFNPFLKTNGKCAPNNVYSLGNSIPAGSNATAGTAMCAFDFVSTIDIYPEFKRDALFLSGEAKLNDKFTFFSDLALSRYDLIARIAPNPVPVAIPVTSALYTKYVQPYLSADQQAHVSTVTANYRATDFGTRDSNTITDATHFVGGIRGALGDWDLESAFTWSKNKLDEKYVGGYFKATEFRNIIANNSIDPFVPSGNQTAAAQQLIADSIYHGSIRTASTTLSGLDVRASGEIAKLPAGSMSLGVGGDVRNFHFIQTPSADAVGGLIYNFAANPAYDLERRNYGVYSELAIPVIKSLDVTAALRYDAINPIKDAINQRDFGEKLTATTYKLSARYQATRQVLLRGSMGTGFKAPDVLDIAQPLVNNGVTAAKYPCPFTPADGKDQPPCKPGALEQYSQLSGGNENLKPERSKQATVGLRIEPTANFSLAMDYWQVKMRDAISGVSADQAFKDPAKYSSLFTTYRTPAETSDYYAFMALSTNIGQVINKGIDWELEGRLAIPALASKLTTSLSGTYMIKSSYTRAGTSDDFTDSMGKYGENAAVTFRNIIQANFRLESGAFTNQFTIKARSGYTDKEQTVRDLSTGKNTTIKLAVPRYMTVDYQGGYKFDKKTDLRLGITNLLNERPPLTLRDSSGHQVGYDPRYASPMMRTLYVMGNYTY